MCGLWQHFSVNSDVLCGQLLCAPTGRLVNFEYSLPFTKKASVGPYQCNSVIIDVGTQQQSPGFVLNGAPCGVGKVL